MDAVEIIAIVVAGIVLAVGITLLVIFKRQDRKNKKDKTELKK